ncbi:hypothetical protein [Paludisphaera rhizosphaerae]|uniref:hypothetical protein n=1 Tax=Paludisphaera rhizosphaerae TaxID=2711216 RepID=UPI0013ED6C6F|nr:hypothetical protein [Paludisphaera rhizosphaerae]
MKAKAAFRMLLAISACLAAAGCRTAGPAPSKRTAPPPSDPVTSFRIDDFVREHNLNARLVKNVKARPSIYLTAADPNGGDPKSAGLSGRLLVVQPYDFKLLVESKMTTDLADIGSNEKEFWFWLKDNPEKQIFRCAYSDLGKSDLPATFQPDWIMTAMGLKPITRDEAASARILPGERPGTTLLKFPPSSDPASAYLREMVVDEASNRLVEYRVYDRDGKTLIGQARIGKYQELELKDEAAAGSNAPASPVACHLPDSFSLDWKREGLKLDITMNASRMNPVAVNSPPFNPTVMASFVPPTISGYQAVDIAEMARTRPRGDAGAGRDGETTIRETIPPPERTPSRRRSQPVDADVTLGPPVGLEIKGARLQSPDADPNIETAPRSNTRPASRRNAPRTVAPTSSGSLLLPVLEDPIGAVTPGSTSRTAGAADLITPRTYER